MGKNVTHTAMSARLMELAGEMKTPAAYPVTESITIAPLTRARKKAMNEAELQMYICRQMLGQAVALSATPAPVLAVDATDDQRLEHGVAYAEWEKNGAAVQEKIGEINTKLAESETDYEKAFFGPAHKAVIDYFEDKPALWDLFVEDIKAEFLPAAPSDGVCPTCGRTDEVQAGKAPEPST